MLEFVNKYLIGTSVPLLLIAGGIFFLVKLRGRPVICPILTARAMLTPSEDSKNGLSPFRSVTMALAGTLGVGNIVGVASAIALGGFGSIFWMWISALAAMILKYAEITISVSHRRKRNGENHGGAMYYIEDRFEAAGRKGQGRTVGWIFAALCLVVAYGVGCMMQVNAVSSSFEGVFGVSPWICGALLAAMTAPVITKGTRGISALTEWLVPLMSVGYVIMSVVVMIKCRGRLGEAFVGILTDAFTVKSTAGGILGFLVSDAVRFGTMRGLLSNEAGCGTAPFAHAASDATQPAKQGAWGIFEVFVDTILLCTMTALVIILNYDQACAYSDNGIMMTLKAYSASLGVYAEYFLTAAVLLFAYATVICWAQYGMECVLYMFKNRKKARVIYYTSFCVAAFLGAIVAPGAVWALSDAAMGSMTLINLAVIAAMSTEIKGLTEEYFGRKKR